MPARTGPLDPHNRRLLFESLRPPVGYELDFAVGTTFSLDLTALAVVPLAFTPFADEVADEASRALPDPLALLEGLRRNSERIAVFCQAGQIAIPRQRSRLLGFLEDCICEVRARRKGGVFHPKIWLLRFESATRAPRYRLLCLSRNLTFDRSWDTILMLEGELETTRRSGLGVNNPLGDFVAELPTLAIGDVPVRVQEGVARLSSEVRRVRFLPPTGFDSFAFHPLGVGNARPFPPGESDSRVLVVSPFLARDTLARLAVAGRRHVLVSRADALLELATAGGPPKSFEQLYTMDEGAEPEPDEEPGDDGEEATISAASTLDATLAGLHAKLYVVEEGPIARVLTGSANATEAAFNRNVEFLIELRGPSKICGVDAFLGKTDESTKGATSLADLLRPWSPPKDSIAPNPTRRKLEQLIEKGRIDLASANLELAATPLRRRLLPYDSPARR